MWKFLPYLDQHGAKPLLGIIALLAVSCTHDSAKGSSVSIGDGSVTGGNSMGTGGSAGDGDASTTGSGGSGSQGGAMSKTGGSDGSNVFPSLDATVDGSGGASNPNTVDASIDSGMLSDGSTGNSIDSANCFNNGVAAAFVGDGVGSCEMPLGVDLSAGNPGDVSYVTLPTTSLDVALPATSKCGADTARDLVLLVWVPHGADLEVTVDAAKGADPLIVVMDPPTADCSAGTISQCVDRGGIGQCEYLRIRAPSASDPGYRQLVVSELVDSGTPYTLRLRLQNPSGGA